MEAIKLIQDYQVAIIKPNVVLVEKQAFLIKDIVKDSNAMTKFLGFTPTIAIENGILCAKIKGFKKFTAGCVLVKTGSSITEIFTNLDDFNVKYSIIGKLYLSDKVETPSEDETKPKN